MVVTCCVRSCKEKFVKGGKITFHAFPSNEERRKLWTLSLGRKDFVPSIHSKICSKHFAEECFDREKFGGHWLKPTAVPTIYDFPKNILPKKVPRRSCKKRSIEEEGCSSLVATTTTVEPGKPHSCDSESLPSLEDNNSSVVSTSHSTIKRSLNCLVEATTTVESRKTCSSKRKSCPLKDTNSSAASTSHSTLKRSGKKNCLVATTTTIEPEKVHSHINESSPLEDIKSSVASISQPSHHSSGEKYLLVATTAEPENLHFHINEPNPTLKDIKSCVASTSESSPQCSGEKYVLVAATTTVEPINANSPNNKSHPLENTNSAVASTSHSTLTRSEKEYQHVSDFTMEDMESPSKAKKLFQMATKNHKKNRQLENKLYARFTRLKKKVNSLQAIVNEFKKNSLISEGAVDILEVKEEAKSQRWVAETLICLMVNMQTRQCQAAAQYGENDTGSQDLGCRDIDDYGKC